MTKKTVINEASKAVALITGNDLKHLVTIKLNKMIILTIGNVGHCPTDSAQTIKNRAITNLTLLLSDFKDKKGFDWDMS